ncbi:MULTISPECIES: PspC domain-containing protein [Turicibacter]|jgi:pspC domain protein|uniref:PspC domain-containing protein n=3 Tax=Turicibacter sanguinis TaxID=154288 RepID=A0A9X4XFJ2_9FIRM|nr:MULTISPECIES: PspC domain-containing protein [Turicibacter]EFF65040.1 PspC domain protein [Turicibacter sanguinis PC909]MBP3903653.1 PspC domain-containing protein [Turicibacter sp.]MCU7191622.1 PspC domain-containing protein [Turicibacter sanguinis]MCU7212822.1 PspC domain-containing protein [Turicibacter sanguinis]MDB8438680.1 PspC domain-containing protein [Turicibacter sanguinis]
MSNKRLYKTSQGAMLGGVCKGISEYLNIDVTLIRLVWVLISFTSVGIILYIACVFIFPDKATIEREKRQTTKDAVFETNDYKVKDQENKKDKDYTIY